MADSDGGQCFNTDGSYICACKDNHFGNGIKKTLIVGNVTGTGCQGKWCCLRQGPDIDEEVARTVKYDILLYG